MIFVTMMMIMMVLNEDEDGGGEDDKNDDDFESGPISHYKKFPGREKFFLLFGLAFQKCPYTIQSTNGPNPL